MGQTQISPETYTIILNYIDEHVEDKQQAKEFFYSLFEPYYFDVSQNPCIEDMPIIVQKNVKNKLDTWKLYFAEKGEDKRHAVNLILEAVSILEP